MIWLRYLFFLFLLALLLGLIFGAVVKWLLPILYTYKVISLDTYEKWVEYWKKLAKD